MMAISMLPTDLTVSGDTETQFGDGSDEKVVDFPGKGSDNETTIKLPFEAEVSQADLKVQGGKYAGSYLYHPTVLVENSVLWNFNGDGFGYLGEQDVFRDNFTSNNISFSGKEEKSTTLYLPKNATVTSATMDLTGKKSVGAMTPPEVLSKDTLITSAGELPQVVSDGSDVYMLWVDNGDLDFVGKDKDIFFKKSSDNGQSWTEPVCLSDTSMFTYTPALGINGDEIYAVWTESEMLAYTIFFRMSTDGGIRNMNTAAAVLILPRLTASFIAAAPWTSTSSTTT